MEFFIGDKVSLIHSTESGVITRIEDKIIHVETADGFEIPVARNELTLARSTQRPRIDEKEKPNPSLKNASSVGIYFGFVPENDGNAAFFYIINNTDVELLYSLLEDKSDKSQKNLFKGISRGIVAPRNFEQVYRSILGGLKSWPKFQIEILQHAGIHFKKSAPLSMPYTFKAEAVEKYRMLPLLGRTGFCTQLDSKELLNKSSAKELEKQLLSSNTKSTDFKSKPIREVEELDLHADKLFTETQLSEWSDADILEEQKKAIVAALDDAILKNLAKITFIHGVGNGTLMSEVQKVVSKHPRVDTFMDARKERFGYGALDVILK